MGGVTMMSVLQHPKVRVVGLCDVDATTLERARGGQVTRRKELQDPEAAARWGGAVGFKDYREMLAKLGDTVDAVTIGTPDHTHAAMAVAALRAGKHVYLQKPLTHHLHEARVLGVEAAKAGVTTQMGTQGHSSVETSLTVDLIKSGAIGKVKEVICWENKKANWWPKVTARKAQADVVPESLDWDLWLGVMLWGLALGQWLLARRPGLLAGEVHAALKPLAGLGRWSLSFYMLHQPVLIGLLMAIKRWG